MLNAFDNCLVVLNVCTLCTNPALEANASFKGSRVCIKRADTLLKSFFTVWKTILKSHIKTKFLKRNQVNFLFFFAKLSYNWSISALNMIIGMIIVSATRAQSFAFVRVLMK